MEDEIAKLFGIQDVGYMVAIGIVAWVFKRSAKIPEDLALLIPLILGGIVGGISAYEGATIGSGILLKGIIITGAGATIFARLADELLIRVGLIKKQPTAEDRIVEEEKRLAEDKASEDRKPPTPPDV